MADIELEKLAESVGAQQLNEGNPFKRFEKKLNDRSNVHEFVILTSMNPGRPDDVAEGEDRDAPLDALKALLRRGQYGWVPVRGKYGEEERSFLVPNMTTDEAIRICQRFGQDSFIHGIRNEDGGMRYEYWESPDGGRTYTISREKERYDVMDSDADDMFSDRRGFKFQIPFFEAVESAIAEYDKYILENCSKHMDFETRNRLISEAIKAKGVGHRSYMLRGEILESDSHFYRMKEEMENRHSKKG